MSNDREMDHLENMSDMNGSRHWNQPYCYAGVVEEECDDPLQLALANAYSAYMRGLYREAMRKDRELLLGAMLKAGL
jgi:hypothetical protein